jgi:translation initiation factor 1A
LTETGKRKVLTEQEIKEEVTPGPGEVLGTVTKLLGFDRVMVKCADGYDRLCRIQGRMKRRIWIREGDTVIVAPWDFQYETRGDIVWRYPKPQAEAMRTRLSTSRS